MEKLNIKFILFLIASLFIFTSCEEDVESGDGSSNNSNQSFDSGFLFDYFYDLDNESVDVQFLHYRKAEDGYSNTISDTTKIDVTKDTINFRTYNEFRLKVPESEIDNYNQYTHFDETNEGICLEENNTCIDIDYRNSQGEHYLIDGNSDPVLEDDGSEDGIDDNWEGFSTTAPECVSPVNDGLDNNDNGSIDELGEKGSPYACYDKEQAGTYEINSNQYTSIAKIIWDIDGSRYKTYLDTTFIHYEDPDDPDSDFTTSQWEYSSVEIELGVDTPIYNYDSLIYMTSINDFISPDTGIFYLDTLEFIKTNFLYTSEDIEVFEEFTFDNMNILSQDSSIYRVITDCNQNSEHDEAEPQIYDYNSNGMMEDILNESELDQDYCGADSEDPDTGWRDGIKDDICYEFSDLGNSVLDEAELYYDLNGNGEYNSSSELGAEPFQDRNCNGIWDDAEAEDVGNGIWDDAEYFVDSGDLNGIYDIGEFIGSKITSVPSNLLFDYSEIPPSPIIEIDEFGQFEDNIGNLYSVIDVITILDSVYNFYPKVDSVVTIFSNEVITHFASDPSKDLDYVITKTRSAYPDPLRPGGDFDISQYNYNIFNTENHIKELKNPSFFLPYGFYETPDAISDGFWFDICRDTLDIFLYAPDGIISEGDNVYELDTLIVNGDKDCDGDGIFDNAGNGDYNIEVNVDVEFLDTLMVKMRKVLTNEDGLCLGGELHLSLEPLIVSNPEDCYKTPTQGGIGAAALDTIIIGDNVAVKITKTLIMTYIGSGVEYGERVTMWLGRDIDYDENGFEISSKSMGIVKNYLDIRWSEPFWVDGEQWKPYSRWELVEKRESNNSNLSRLTGKRKVSYEDFETLIEFDNEPFERRRTAGLHRVKINN